VGVTRSGDAEAQLAGDERDGDGSEPVVEFGAGLAADGDGVLEAGGGNEGDARALALEHGVGADGGAVANVDGDVWVDGFGCGDFAEGVEDGLGGVGGGGEEFEDFELARGEVDTVGEGAAGVDSYAEMGLGWHNEARAYSHSIVRARLD
jgi:hypothetical protein